MQLKFVKSLLPAQNYESSIISMAWSPNNEKLAVATTDRLILLYNESGDLKDKFQTKPADANDGKKSYLIQSICFSPDAAKLAVAQTDSIVYVYKIGESWGYKKVICNKFLQQCPITCMTWLSTGPLICGLLIGQVIELNTKTNKSQQLYSTDSTVMSLCSNCTGTGLLSGHVDGNIIRFFKRKEGHENDRKFICYPSVPSILVWTEKCVMVAGLDRKICFYDIDGLIVKQFDYSNENFDNDFSSAAYNQMAKTILVGSSNRVRKFVDKGNSWQELDYVDLQNFYTITALAWRNDGTKIACGSLCGSLILLESVTRRIIWKNDYEISFIGRNYVIIKSLKSSKTTTIASKFGIGDLNFKLLGDNRYFVAKSDESLIISDLITNKTSQILWNTGSTKINEKFNFRHENICLIRCSAQLFVIVIGKDVIDYTLTTKYIKEDLISLQYGENGKYLAYLEEPTCAKILNIDKDTDTHLINHEIVIDWIQLSNTGKMLIYRDVQKNVYLYDFIVLNKIEIMNCVRFVKWLRNDSFVCQNAAILAVWLDINTPEHLQMEIINDMVVDVVKTGPGKGGGIQVVIDRSNGGKSNLEFDNQIAEFRLAIKNNDIKMLAELLKIYPDKLSHIDQTWLNLANIALSNKCYFLSENYYAALREYTSCLYLKNIKEFLKTGERIDDCIKNAILNNDFLKAEQIYFEKNDIGGAISMYRKLHYWDDALRISKKHDPDTYKNIRNDQIEYLKSTNKFEKVAKIFEQDNDYENAFECYLQGSKPDQALSILCNRLKNSLADEKFVQRAVNQFEQYGFLEHSGDLCLKCERVEDALNYYQQCKVWSKVIGLSNDVRPDKVSDYYQCWAVDLMASEQWDESIDCFIKAGCPNKAFECAINGKLWKKAVDITKFIENPEHVETHYVQLADHFISEKDYVTAESLLLSIKQHEKAIDMLNETYQWEKAYKLAKNCLNDDAVDELFRNQAKQLESLTKFLEAERILLMLNDADSAIEMYKNIEQFDHMIRLVEKYHPDLLLKTHYYVAVHLESRGSFSDAEAHYLAANEWKKAVNMYRNAAMWDDAYRIAKKYGGKRAANQVIFLRAKDLPISSAKKYLEKIKLHAECINYACDIEDFQWAFELCNNSGNMVQDIHYKYAKKLQNDGKYSEAEHEYIVADSAKQVVAMYLETKDWMNAIRVAETVDKKLVDDILKTQALYYFEEKKFPEFQSIFIRLKAIDDLISHYKSHDMWTEALKICKEHKPNLYHELLKEFNSQKVDESDIDALINQANQWINVEQYQEAVSCFMKISPDTTEESIMRKVLLKIVEIITKFFAKNATIDVIRVIGPQLVKIKENTIAAQLYISIEMFKEAIDVLIGCNDWKRAKKVAQKFDSSLDTYVNTKYKEALQQTSDVDKLIDIDIDFNEALNLLLTNGEWVKCLEKSKSQNDELFQQYFAKFAEHFCQNGDVCNALEMFTKYGIPSCTNGPKYLVEVANNIFADCENVQLFVQLRDLLHSLVIINKLSNSKLNDQLSTYFLISYFYTVQDACYETESQLSQIRLKISISLLRFCNIIPADKVFYDAATNLRKMRRDSEAFVFFNYYLNICDAIENRRTNLNLTIPELPHLPQSIQLPKQLYWKNQLDKHDKVREWILEVISMDHKVSKKLPLSQESFYESYLKSEDDFCVITGYAIKNQFVTFNKSKLKANRDSWAKITMTAKKLPVSHKLNNLMNFIEKWCGTSNFSYL